MVQGSRRAGPLLTERAAGEGTSMWDVVRIIAVLIIVEGLVLVGRSRGWLRDY